MPVSISESFSNKAGPQENIETIARAGFTHVNFTSNFFLDLIGKSKPDLGGLLRQLQQTGLGVDWIHGPYGRNFRLYTPNVEHRSVTLAILYMALDTAAALGARVMVFHPLDETVPNVVDSLQPQLIESFGYLAEHGRKVGVRVAVENLPILRSNSLVVRLLEEVPDLCLCLDSGHAHLTNSWNLFLPKYGTRVAALHLHDNHGQEDEHLPPGDGTIDFPALIHKLSLSGYEGVWGLETEQKKGTHPGSALQWAQRIHGYMDRVVQSVPSVGAMQSEESSLTPAR